jgi:ABC-2 type transport system permease protein
MTAGSLTPTIVARPAGPPSVVTATFEVARRVLRKFVRTPGLWAMAVVQSALFLFSFRYVFGGAIHTGASAYVEFLVPGYVATLVLFAGGGTAVAVAEDRAQGFTDRLLSLPIPRNAIAAGRSLADFVTTTWAIAGTVAFGFLIGFRLHGADGGVHGLFALTMCLVYGLVFTVVFVVIGLVAPNAQAAQGMSMIAFVLAFFSSTYVPVASMPGWLQPFAKYQPITPMVDAVRSVLVGSTSDLGLALVWSGAILLVFTPLAAVLYRRG